MGHPCNAAARSRSFKPCAAEHSEYEQVTIALYCIVGGVYIQKQYMFQMVMPHVMG